MDQPRNEHELALRAAGGDQDALAALVERLRLWLFTRAYAELRHYEDAQDAVAAALLRICLHAHEVRYPEQMRAWMGRIVLHEASRLRQRRAPLLSLVDAESLPQPSLTADITDLRLDIERALRRLPIDQARAISLHYLASMPLRQIAHLTGRSEGTIKSWLHHGRQRLAEEMKEYAPMTARKEATAVILSTDLDATVLKALTAALHKAGFSHVRHLDDYKAIAHLEQTGEGDTRELHIAEQLAGTDFLVVDEWVGGRSVFEFFAILRATAEREHMAACILLNGTDPEVSRISVLAAWASGFDLCLTKPVDAIEFERFARRIQESLENRRA